MPTYDHEEQVASSNEDAMELDADLGKMLVADVVPRLRSLSYSVPKVGADDEEEIVQDATLLAARMMLSASRSGRSFTAGSIAHFATKAVRAGRRSHYTGRSDVLSPGCQLDGNSRFNYLDGDVEFDEGESGSLHDVVALYGCHGCERDPSEEAARNADWEAFLATHSPRHRIAIKALLEGESMREAGKRCGLKDSAALILKRKIAADLVEFFGADTIRSLLDGIRPDWMAGLQASRERCLRHEGAFQPHPQPED